MWLPIPFQNHTLQYNEVITGMLIDADFDRSTGTMVGLITSLSWLDNRTQDLG